MENKLIHSIPPEEVLIQNESELVLKVRIAAESDYFDGHFPQFKLLPAVAQIDLLAHYSAKYFGLPLSTPKIKRFKFADKILPDTSVIFTIKFDSTNRKLTFDISDSEKGTSYSSGTYSVK